MEHSLVHLGVIQPKNIPSEFHEPDHGRIQHLDCAVLFEEVLMPNVQRAGLILYIAVGNKNEGCQDVAHLASLHVTAAVGESVLEVGTGMGQNGDDVVTGVVTQTKKPEHLEEQLDSPAVYAIYLYEL